MTPVVETAEKIVERAAQRHHVRQTVAAWALTVALSAFGGAVMAAVVIGIWHLKGLI